MPILSRFSYILAATGTEQNDQQSSGSNWVTDKMSSSILIYQNKDTDIYTENGEIFKTEWNEELIKNDVFLIREGLFN